LGQKVDNKNRPLLVSVEDVTHIANILSRAPSLQHHAQYKNIYIVPDMTKFQREKHRKLVHELRSRKDVENPDHFKWCHCDQKAPKSKC